MTTYRNINTFNIILLFLRNRSFKEIGFTFKLNYHILTVLIGLYIHSITSNKQGICITNLVKFLGYYTSTQLHRYLDKLIACNMVKLDNRLYYLTELGFQQLEVFRKDQKVWYMNSVVGMD